MKNIHAVWMEINNEIFHELQQMIHEGTSAEHQRPLSEEAAAVRLDVVEASLAVSEIEEEVEEEDDRERVEVEHEELDLHLRDPETGVNEVVDGDGDVDGDDGHAVEAREGSHQREYAAVWARPAQGQEKMLIQK